MAPLRFSQNPLWSWFVGLIAKLPLGSVSVRLNFLSAIFGAGTIWMLFRVTADALWMAIPVSDLNVRAANRASWLGGLVAALALMGSMPFWYAATRFHMATFDLFLLLVLAALFIKFIQEGTVLVGLVFAFLYGVLAVEFATMIIFGPLVLIGLLYGLWIHGDLRWKRVLGLAGCLAAGMLVYGLAAVSVWRSDIFALQQETRFGMALLTVIRGQYQLIAKGLPEVGWLLVIVAGIVPWLAVLAVGRRGLNEERDWGLYSLHFILTGVVLAVLFNVPFSPWRVLGIARLLVTPYLLLAFTLGYLVAYWSFISRMIWWEAEEGETRRLWLREYGGMIPVGLIIVATLTAGVLNFKTADARPAGAINAYARSVIQAARDRQWLATDGVLDSNLQVAAHEMGVPIRILNLRLGGNALYMRHVAQSFDDPRLKGLAEVDGMAFLQEWMQTDPAFAGKIAFLNYPDFWLAAKQQPVSDRVLFRGVPALEAVELKALWDAHQEFWKSPFIAGLAEMRGKSPMLSGLATHVLRQLSMVANNLGVLMEDVGWRKQAYEAYAKSRELDEDNISALLNQETMLRRGYAAPDAEGVHEAVKKLAQNLKQKYHIWSLSRVYGYVRMPEAYADLGFTWAYSGQPGLAVAGYRRAIELAPERKERLSQGLAMAYVAQDQPKEGEAVLKELLAANPTNVVALLSLSRIATRRGDYEAAMKYLDRIQATGIPKTRLAVEYAVLHLAAGEPGKARIVLQELVDLKPDLAVAWAMLGGVVIEQNDAAAIAECERKLQKVKGRDFMATAVLGQMALYRRNYAEARIYLDQALEMRPTAVALLELLLRLDVKEGRRDLAATHVRRLLLLDSGHAYANQVLASMQLERREYAQAESSLRKALAKGRTADVLNDLAWVLQERGSLEDAEALAREAVGTDARNPNFQDTLGVILMARGDLKGAEVALRKALELAPEAMVVQLHLAELYGKKGELDKAAALADQLMARISSLPPAEQEQLRKIARKQ
jgi:tetratricopeptide (TPR) repeat protein